MTTLPASRPRAIVGAVALVATGAGLVVSAAFLSWGVAAALAVAGVFLLAAGLLAVRVA